MADYIWEMAKLRPFCSLKEDTLKNASTQIASGKFVMFYKK